MGEVVNLDEKRQERWIRILETKRDLGQVAIFGVIGEAEAVILDFPEV